MEKINEQVFKVFNFLAREIQIYLFGGIVVAINVIIIDHFYYHTTLLTFIRTNSSTIPIMIVLYLLGQFCMAFYSTILVWTNLEKKINKIFGFDYTPNTDPLPKLYKKNQELYSHFVDRYLIQILTHCTICAACFINLVTDIIVLLSKGFHWQISLSAIIFGIGTIAFFLISSQIEKENQVRINSLDKLDKGE